LALPGVDEPPQIESAPESGPWSEPQEGKPFLPSEPPIADQGPWGPKR
jgi:hypothetical protein